MGATIAWQCSQYDQLFTGVIGFYGSRIRDFLDMKPACNTLLFFSEVEASFNPREVANVLEKKEKLCVKIVKGSMGSPIQILRLFTLNLKSLLSRNRWFYQRVSTKEK